MIENIFGLHRYFERRSKSKSFHQACTWTPQQYLKKTRIYTVDEINSTLRTSDHSIFIPNPTIYAQKPDLWHLFESHPKKNEKITYRLQAPMFFQRALSFWVSQSPGHGFVHWTSGLSSLSIRVRYIPPKDLDPCHHVHAQTIKSYQKKLNSQIYFRTWFCSHHSDSFSIIQPFRTFFSLSSWIFAGPFGCHSVGAHLPWVFPQVPQLPQTLNSWVNRSPANDTKKGSSWSRIDYISQKRKVVLEPWFFSGANFYFCDFLWGMHSTHPFEIEALEGWTLAYKQDFSAPKIASQW